MTTTNGPAGNLRKRKSQTILNSEKIATGQSTAMMKINARPTEHGQEMDKKLDEHESWVVLM
jgi:delta24(24(1))-sterol reductase